MEETENIHADCEAREAALEKEIKTLKEGWDDRQNALDEIYQIIRKF